MFSALRQGMKEAGFYYSQMIIWFKNQVVMNRKDYLMMFELIAYGWFGKHKMERSKAKSVIVHPKPSASRLHPTQYSLIKISIQTNSRITNTIWK
jgi:hypothetical protein